MDESGENWKSFGATQQIVIDPPSFTWDARVRMALLLDVRVWHAYLNGGGILTARVFGLLKVMEMEGSPVLAQSQLMRFAAESIWCPSVLLPGAGVSWEGGFRNYERVAAADYNFP
jgi:hypothetical protein